MERTENKLRIICEAGIMLAIAQILSYIRLYKFPNGGSVDFAMLPIVIFCARYGVPWGALTGFVYGILQYFIGLSTSIDWTTLLADYLIAYSVLGLGAGIAHYMSKNRMSHAIIIGGAMRFCVHLVVGALVWGKYMPETFWNMHMTSVWVYSFLYNGSYMFIDIMIVLIAVSLLRKPLSKILGEGM